jgi:hypothetical protein
MPIQCTISHDDRLVLAVCRDEVSRADLEAYLDEVVVKGAMPYAKIFDTTGGTMLFSQRHDDMMAIGARIQAYAKTEPMGPLAIVAVSDQHVDTARMFGALGAGKRPIKIFTTQQAARAWLTQNPTGS